MTKHQLELIERYLEQKMSAAEMARFEDAMLHDPLLKNEFELQKDIIESIKAYRKSEIKARLENISINPAPLLTSYMKIAASITITSFIAWGTYTYFGTSDLDLVERVEIPATIDVPRMEVAIPDMPLVQLPMVAEAEEPKPAGRLKTAAVRKEIKLPELRLPDVLFNFEDTSPVMVDEGFSKTQTRFPNLDDKTLVPEIMVQDMPGRKNQFFYQNYEGKLYLYGNFSASPYVLMELNTTAGRRLFLHYDDSFYNIKSDQNEIVPLEKLQDTSLVNELNVLKGK
jgi:hypothetical protein